MRLRRTGLAVVVGIGLMSSAGRQLAAQSRPDIDQILETASADGSFAGVVLVRQGDREVYFRAIGDAVREFDLPHARDTRFKYHSLTKPLLSTLFHLLANDGIVSPSTSICSYLDPCPTGWGAVQPRHLLNHSSGIPELENEWYSHGQGDLQASWEAIVASSEVQPLETTPGETFRYSNGGYTLLSLIVERATDLAIHQVMADRLFSAAGMKDAGLEMAPDPDVTAWYRGHVVIDRLANGYNGSPSEARTAYSLMYTVPGAGAVYGTADDLANFARAVFAEGLLPRDQLDAMLRIEPEVNPRYARGWVVSERHGATTWSHTGGTNGFLSALEYYPANETTVVVLSNLGFADLRSLTNEIAATALRGN